MTVQIEGVHYNVSDHTHKYIDEKLPHLDYLKEYILDLSLRLIKEKRDYAVEADIHLHWGTYHHIKTEEHELYKAIDLIFDKIESKVIKEKDKIKEH